VEPPTPLEHDLRIILSIQSSRAFGYGFASVVLGAALADGGLSDGQVGLVFAAILAGNALVSIAIGLAGDRIGRRRAYVLLLLVMSAAGVAYALSDSVVVLVLVALTGTLSTDANESGPLTSLEQAMLGGVPTGIRARVFGRYNAIAYLAGAVGALASGGPALIRERIPNLPTDRRWLLVLTVAGAVCVALTRRLSPAIDRRTARVTAPLHRSRTDASRLAALFGLTRSPGGSSSRRSWCSGSGDGSGRAQSSWAWRCSVRGCSRLSRPSRRDGSPRGSACSRRWCSPTCRRTSC
jgi:MFS family permease